MKRAALLAVLLCGVRSEAAQWMATTESFLCTHCEAPVDAYQQLRDANVRYVRYFVPWPLINPQRDVYHWEQVDRELARIHASGMKIYANITGAPAFASQEQPTYAMYTDGCTAFDNEAWVRIVVTDDAQQQPDNGGPLSDQWARKDTFFVQRGGSITIPAPGVLANDGRRGQGLEAVTNWQPSHGTLSLNHDGSFTYQHDGSSAAEDGFKYWVWGLSDGIHFASDDHDYCAHPAHINPEEVRLFMSRFIERYGDIIDLYGVWNEPGLPIYWPPSQTTADPFTRFRDEVIVPFVETVRAQDPSALTVGPECDSGWCIDSILRLEREANARWFDILSFHPYPWSVPDTWVASAVRRIDDEFKPSLDRWFDGRPVWATEVGPPMNGDYGADAAALAHAVSARPWIGLLGFHLMSTWFAPGTYDDQTYAPNALYEYTASTARPRRRAIRITLEP
jgi:hypothetical protein